MFRTLHPFLSSPPAARLLPAAGLAWALGAVPPLALAFEPLAVPAPLAVSHAEPPVPEAAVLTLPLALARALAANPELEAARHELAATAGAVLQAGARPNPTLELMVEDQRRQTRETTLQASQPLELGSKRAARMQAAQGERQAAAAALLARQAGLRSTVITAFFQLLATQQRWQLAQEASVIAGRATAAAARQVRAGKVSPMEETRARVAAAGVQLSLYQARNALEAARRQLAATWNEPAAHFAHAEGQVDVLPELPDLESLLALLPTAPAVVQAQAELEQRQAQARVAQSQRLPDVTLSLGVRRLEEEGRNQAMVGVSLPLPLFDRNRGNVLQALRRSDAARAQLRATELRLQGELHQAHAALATVLEQIRLMQDDILPGAESAYQAAARGFEYGKFGFTEVLDAQRTLLQARSQHLDALADAHRSQAELLRIVGASPLVHPEQTP